MGMVVEGVRTTKAAHELAEKMEVEMPITAALYDVLFNGNNVKDAVGSLMGRVRKHEVEAIPDLLKKSDRSTFVLLSLFIFWVFSPFFILHRMKSNLRRG